MNQDGKIKAGILSGPFSALRQYRFNAESVLSGTRFPASLLTNPETPIGAGDYIDLLDRCSALSRDPLFSLRCGLSQNIDDLGLYGRLVMSAPTVWESLESIAAGARHFQDGAKMFVERNHGRCLVLYQHEFDAPESSNDVDLTIGLLANVLASAQATRAPDMKLFFPSAEASILWTPKGPFACSSSSVGMAEFDEAFLSSPMKGHDSARWEVLWRYHHSRRFNPRIGAGIAETVGSLLSAMMGVVKPTLPTTSAILRVSERKLQRMLADEGANFRGVLDQVRMETARFDLASGESPTDIAFKLGYDHPANFTTAFRRWFHVTPTAFQMRLIGPAPGSAASPLPLTRH
jgi:AraC-like DNA-binding protein